ncbi:putative F-box/LRR-repeat protein [Cardamine amara subsp. amara]|uniref:F-box/LRR-repeat protein n=1 Tax=Cardamine amara subsp. amara TaxID=228776 RepID=A0ABD1B9R6_CARAN
MANRREKRGRRQRHRNPRNHKIRRLIIMDGADFINSMPDEILHHILSFVPTKLAVRTCVLSKRWRHVWCGTPSLDVDDRTHKAGQIKQDLISYTATNITSFKLRMGRDNSAAEVDTWLDFAISRNVKKLRELSLRYCKLRDESMDNILSDSPILESLTLCECRLLKRLDLSKSPSLRRLKIDRTFGPIVIVAPHIYII